MGECVYSQNVDKGLDHYLLCSKSGSYCKYQKYCNKKKRAINTDDYNNCSLVKEEEISMSKTTQKKKINSDKSVKELEIASKNNKLEEKHRAYYEVLIATPTYYILNINGCPTKIFGNNNYRKGDTVEF